jgi:hypothetical protein
MAPPRMWWSRSPAARRATGGAVGPGADEGAEGAAGRRKPTLKPGAYGGCSQSRARADRRDSPALNHNPSSLGAPRSDPPGGYHANELFHHVGHADPDGVRRRRRRAHSRQFAGLDPRRLPFRLGAAQRAAALRRDGFQLLTLFRRGPRLLLPRGAARCRTRLVKRRRQVIGIDRWTASP